MVKVTYATKKTLKVPLPFQENEVSRSTIYVYVLSFISYLLVALLSKAAHQSRYEQATRTIIIGATVKLLVLQDECYCETKW